MFKKKIKNRKHQNIVIIVDKTPKQQGMVIIMHGLGGFKEQKHIQTFASSFKQSRYTVVFFDTTNTLGESDGDYANATYTNYYQDLEDVISWVKTQSFYQEPFILAGHSLGSYCITLYAEKHPEEIKALAPISTGISGKLMIGATTKDILRNWKKTGWLIQESSSKPGVMKKLKWSFVMNSLKHDILPNANKLTMPVILIVGDKDTSTPVAHQKIFFNKIPGKKEFHIIKGAPHTFRNKKHLREIKDILLTWIRKLE
jgi:pimeloyl-ACP methyl ester carboxylesterase